MIDQKYATNPDDLWNDFVRGYGAADRSDPIAAAAGMASLQPLKLTQMCYPPESPEWAVRMLERFASVAFHLQQLAGDKPIFFGHDQTARALTPNLTGGAPPHPDNQRKIIEQAAKVGLLTPVSSTSGRCTLYRFNFLRTDLYSMVSDSAEAYRGG